MLAGWVFQPRLGAAKPGRRGLQLVWIGARDLGNELSPRFNERKGKLQQYGWAGCRPRDCPVELLPKIGTPGQLFGPAGEHPDVAKLERPRRMLEEGAFPGVGFEEREPDRRKRHRQRDRGQATAAANVDHG